MKKTGFINFIIGFALGAIMLGGSAAIAAGIMAQPKTAEVVIDGCAVDLNGYVIEGVHYFQLRSIAAALMPGGKDFSVVWDGRNNRIVIETGRGYDPNETIQPTQADTVTQQIGALDQHAAEVVRLTNIEREKAGLPPLAMADDLMELALLKSRDMADNQYFSHDSPTFGKTRSLLDRDSWSRFMGENCARGSRSAQAAVNGWMNLEGHRNNILNPQTTHIGVGVAADCYGILLWTQVFATA